MLVDAEVQVVVQIKGKVRGKVMAPNDANQDALAELARGAVAAQLEGKKVVKTIVVPGKLVNFVVE